MAGFLQLIGRRLRGCLSYAPSVLRYPLAFGGKACFLKGQRAEECMRTSLCRFGSWRCFHAEQSEVLRAPEKQPEPEGAEASQNSEGTFEEATPETKSRFFDGQTVATDAFENRTPAALSSGLQRRMGWHPKKMSGISFELEDKVGALVKALSQFEKHNVSLTRIENRPQPLCLSKQTVVIHFEGEENSEKVEQLMKDVAATCGTKVGRVHIPEVPWFPRHLSDIDQFAQTTLDAGAELNADHPGFHDKDYRQRRKHIVAQASEYQAGERIPAVDYSPAEINCWATIYSKLLQLYPDHACEEFNVSLKDMQAHGIYAANRIPQLQEISDYLVEKTGFRLRPVPGLLSGRDFLNALSLRVFFSTQYIRHPSSPLYTPEPDIIHELMGHAPMLANQDFADFSQIIGLASLGATDDQIKMLATCYWFSVEFGLLFQEGCLRAYGAGLLSSVGELQYATSPTNAKVEIRAWDPFSAAVQEYPITTYQPVYYAAKGLAIAKDAMLSYCQQLAKPFSIRFDPSTYSIITDMSVHPKPVSLKF